MYLNPLSRSRMSRIAWSLFRHPVKCREYPGQGRAPDHRRRTRSASASSNLCSRSIRDVTPRRDRSFAGPLYFRYRH